VTTLPESDVHDIEESEYVRKAEVDEDVNESRLRGLKDRLAASDNDAEQLRDEIEVLEQRIDDLTSFRTGTEMLT
jgi:polyhydroxyalkanoate synthesis regulator phasin